LVSFLSNIIQEADNGISKGLSSQILEYCSENNSKIDTMNNDLSRKILEIQKDYLKEIEKQIKLNNGESNNILTSNLCTNTELLVSRTRDTLNSFIPSINKEIHDIIEVSVDKANNKLMFEIEKIKKNELKMEQFIQNFDETFTKTINSILLNNNKTNDEISKRDAIMNEIRDFCSRFKNSSLKGQLGENRLSNLLTKMFPTGEILDKSNIKESGDFHLKRENKDTILLETKEYDRNVNKDEVDKFIRDCSIQSLHGIFLSQNSGITSKNNFQIEFNNAKILIYVHNCEYSIEKIQNAIDIIDSLSQKIKDNNPDNIHTIPNEVLEEINLEFQRSIIQKQTVTTFIKDSNKKLLTLIDDIQLPKLQLYLMNKFTNC
jgi:hypothetical protein